ncbi:UDP-N-acetylmuramoyl-L-alanine--D-glutamate ligase [Conexibacter sp. DBS9H8]|uniref:Mur ligase family protein n=1 Tax=Conexibacter sp. DBS9H8 TaxID=2937801 RepID=UPI00200CB93D|nr:UDP-N-acetylmuramoyl-L-alanine--D-glutamate ligase [Conexibacter sp. DBS9H8]
MPAGPFLVVGLARSGEAAARLLAERGETVIGADAAGSDRLSEVAERLSAIGVEVQLHAADLALLARAETLVKSPGVPAEAPLVTGARKRGMPVLGELELAWRLLSNEFIAVTGTNGKTTTTEWIAHIHRVAGAPVATAGNVGTALSSLVDRVDPAATIVAECSSFQLEDCVAFSPEAAVLLNLSPDHLDRHHSFAAYRDAKHRIFAHQRPTDVAVLPEGYQVPTRARQVRFGGVAETAVTLPGRHNRANAAAAAAVCLARGLAPDAVTEGLLSFRGVPHRLELVSDRDGIRYVNDSKATNVDSTLTALAAVPAGVHLILGGQGKAQDFGPLVDAVAARCAAVYLIGEDAEQIGRTLARAGVPIIHAGELADAVEAARVAVRRSAAPAPVTILLSPACASFDQFADFEARGDAFRELVR